MSQSQSECASTISLQGEKAIVHICNGSHYKFTGCNVLEKKDLDGYTQFALSVTAGISITIDAKVYVLIGNQFLEYNALNHCADPRLAYQ
jgi:hypothetical protein